MEGGSVTESSSSMSMFGSSSLEQAKPEPATRGGCGLDLCVGM